MAQPASAPATGTATVTVAMNFPQPLILRTFRSVKKPRNVGGVMLELEEFAADGRSFTVHGNAFPQHTGPDPRLTLLGERNIALTPGCPKDLWELWLDQNKSHPLVEAGLIYAFEKMDSVHGQARERADLKNGLERMDPENLPSEFKQAGLKTADKKAA
jgi:hypothetical protein